MAWNKQSLKRKRSSWLLASVVQRLFVVMPLLLLIWLLTAWSLSGF